MVTLWQYGQSQQSDCLGDKVCVVIKYVLMFKFICSFPPSENELHYVES